MEEKRCECKRDVIEVDRCIYLDLIALESRIDVLVSLIGKKGYIDIDELLTIIGTRDALETADFIKEKEEKRIAERRQTADED